MGTGGRGLYILETLPGTAGWGWGLCGVGGNGLSYLCLGQTEC